MIGETILRVFSEEALLLVFFFVVFIAYGFLVGWRARGRHDGKSSEE